MATPPKPDPLRAATASRARALRAIAGSELQWTRRFLQAAVPIRLKPEALEKLVEAVPFTIAQPGPLDPMDSMDGDDYVRAEDL